MSVHFGMVKNSRLIEPPGLETELEPATSVEAGAIILALQEQIRMRRRCHSILAHCSTLGKRLRAQERAEVAKSCAVLRKIRECGISWGQL